MGEFQHAHPLECVHSHFCGFRSGLALRRTNARSIYFVDFALILLLGAQMHIPFTFGACLCVYADAPCQLQGCFQQS